MINKSFTLVMTFALASAAQAQPVTGRITGAASPPLQSVTALQFPSVSPDGSKIFFTSASNAITPLFNGSGNVYRFELATGEFKIASRNPSTGNPGSGNSFFPAPSTNGRFVAFESLANNLGPLGGTNEIYRSDLDTGALVRASESASGTVGNDQSRNPSISGNGQIVVYQSFASNLVASDTNNFADVFAKDLSTGAVQVISLNASGQFGNGNGEVQPVNAISADARFVVFSSTAANMSGSNSAGTAQVYLRDRNTNNTSLMSAANTGAAANSQSDQASISANGRFVVFRSFASNLIAGANNRIYVRDLQSNILASVPLPLGSAVTPPLNTNAIACNQARVSDLGEVLFSCSIASPVPAQAFLFQPGTAQLSLVSRDVGNASGFGNAASASALGISAAGNVIAIESQASNLVLGDTNGVSDVFYRTIGAPSNLIFSNGFE